MTILDPLRWWTIARRWWLRREVAVWYDPAYRLPIASLEALAGIEPRRADFIIWYLLDRRVVPARALHKPVAAEYADLLRVHDVAYLETLTDPESLARIFAVDPREIVLDEVLRTIRLAVGGTVQAALHTVRTRVPSFNLLGGFHHAGRNYGTGFSPLNDIAIAAARLRSEGFRGRIGVIDLDAHPPDGTASALAADPNHWIGSLSAMHYVDIPGVDETKLPHGTGDDAYLAALRALLDRMPGCELAFVVAGGDVLAGDRLGALGLTLAGARLRDLMVSDHLGYLPQVWLPAGGYSGPSWKVFAGSVIAVGLRTRRPIREDYDPLHARFEAIAAGLADDQLAPDDDWSDIELSLGLSRGRRKLFLDAYSLQSLEHRLHLFGILDHVARLGYSHFRLDFDLRDTGDRLRVLGSAQGREHVLVETILERRRVADRPVLYVHWLTLRHPIADFDTKRPKLPGQEVPGLGLAREAGEMLALMARRLTLEGVAFTPAWFHMAYTARYRFRFVDPVRQGRFEALVRDIRGRPLVDVTLAVADGRVLLNGEPYKWESDDMVFWLDGDDTPDPRVAAARDAARFTFPD